MTFYVLTYKKMEPLLTFLRRVFGVSRARARARVKRGSKNSLFFLYIETLRRNVESTCVFSYVQTYKVPAHEGIQ